MGVRLPNESTPSTPPAGQTRVFVDLSDGETKQQDDSGNVVSLVPAIRQEPISIAYNTPGLVLTGIDLYTPTAGEWWWFFGGAEVSITTAWDGNGPTLWFGGSSHAEALVEIDLTTVDESPPATHWASGNTHLANSAFAPVGPLSLLRFRDTAPLRCYIDDTVGGDPGSTQGAAVIRLFIARRPV